MRVILRHTAHTIEAKQLMNFCSACGHAITCRIPEGDNRMRCVCDACGTVHYENPKVLVSVMANLGDRLLWVRRAEAPRAGYWFVPAGFMEQGESLQEAAAREFMEETGILLPASAMHLYAVGSLVDINEVYVAFRTTLNDTHQLNPGAEVSEAGLFSEAQLPWDELAFPDVIEQVRCFYRELHQGQFGIHLGEYRHDSQHVVRVD
jgi:ADP-ribose pyrophosphatase YjhB (NUDIX family)